MSRTKIDYHDEKKRKKVDRIQMLGKAKEKFYAVYYIEYDKGYVYTDYKEARSSRKGKKSFLYTFLTEKEALDYIEEKRKENIEKIIKSNTKFYVAFFPESQTHRYFTNWEICKSETYGITPYFKKFFNMEDVEKWLNELEQKDVYIPADYFIKLREENAQHDEWYACVWKENGNIKSLISAFRDEIRYTVKNKNVNFKIFASKEDANEWIEELDKEDFIENTINKYIDYRKMYEFFRNTILEQGKSILDEKTRLRLFDWIIKRIELLAEKEDKSDLNNLDIMTLINYMKNTKINKGEFEIDGIKIKIEIE